MLKFYGCKFLTNRTFKNLEDNVRFAWRTWETKRLLKKKNFFSAKAF